MVGHCLGSLGPQVRHQYWYAGKVHVGIKDAVCHKGGALRHAAEYIRIMRDQVQEGKSIGLLLTSAPDRNLT